MLADLVSQPHLSVISRSEDAELVKIRNRIRHPVQVDGRTELERLLSRLLESGAPSGLRTLDLIGHSTSGRSLLMLGDWVIDAGHPTVTAFFRGLADADVLPRLGIQAVRLLGCLTADTGYGRWTICTLADILGMEVYGTKDLIFSAHYDEGGFAHERRYVLVGSSSLRSDAVDPQPLTRGLPHPKVLDLDALPTTPLGGIPLSWPLRVATHAAASAMLRMVRRREGATMPGLLAAPMCEIALPSTDTDQFYRIQVLLDGEFVRVYPDGVEQSGVVYPVDDAFELKLLVDRLPTIY